jgi:Fe-Mn family superoxide dismutase
MTIACKSPHTYPFTLGPLPFTYNALEPYINAATIQIHHDKHHQAYITNLNAAIAEHPELHELSIEELLQPAKQLPESIRQTVHDQGGGHLHHELLWKVLQPGRTDSKPVGALANMIDRDFGSLEAFKELFVETGTRHFASGWVFLALDKESGKLEVFTRPDHDSILPENKSVLLINDLWEHAYYLQYRNMRVNYLKAFWNLVNWDYVSKRLENSMSGVSL